MSVSIFRRLFLAAILMCAAMVAQASISYAMVSNNRFSVSVLAEIGEQQLPVHKVRRGGRGGRSFHGGGRRGGHARGGGRRGGYARGGGRRGGYGGGRRANRRAYLNGGRGGYNRGRGRYNRGRHGRRYRHRRGRNRHYYGGYWYAYPWWLGVGSYYYGDNYNDWYPAYRSSGGRCVKWHRRCVANWGYRNSDYLGCMRFHRCRPR